jgi:hypothetical protein
LELGEEVVAVRLLLLCARGECDHRIGGVAQVGLQQDGKAASVSGLTGLERRGEHRQHREVVRAELGECLLTGSAGRGAEGVNRGRRRAAGAGIDQPGRAEGLFGLLDARPRRTQRDATRAGARGCDWGWRARRGTAAAERADVQDAQFSLDLVSEIPADAAGAKRGRQRTDNRGHQNQHPAVLDDRLTALAQKSRVRSLGPQR